MLFVLQILGKKSLVRFSSLKQVAFELEGAVVKCSQPTIFQKAQINAELFFLEETTTRQSPIVNSYLS